MKLVVVEDTRVGTRFNLKSVLLAPKGDIPVFGVSRLTLRLLYPHDQIHVPLRSPQLTAHGVRHFLYHKILYG